MYNNFSKIKKEMKFLKKIATDTEAVQKEHRVVYYNNSNQKICYREPFKWVDLGLESGKKWANMNLGAVTEADYGDYYMWGSTQANTDTICDYANCPYCTGTYNSFTKYNKSDGKTTLESTDDAATQILGGTAHIPTKAEIQELLSKTRKTTVSSYNGTGVRGVKYTSIVNGNSIFIPSSGYRVDNTTSKGGSSGRIWSSSLDNSDSTIFSNAYYLDSNTTWASEIKSLGRHYGYAIRPVLTPQTT